MRALKASTVYVLSAGQIKGYNIIPSKANKNIIPFIVPVVLVVLVDTSHISSVVCVVLVGLVCLVVFLGRRKRPNFL